MPDKNGSQQTTIEKEEEKPHHISGPEPQKPAVRGLEGVSAGDTSVSLVEGHEGRLSYRGYDIHDLAEKSSYEEVLYLLLHGDLPTQAQLHDFDMALREMRWIPDEAMEALRILPKSAEPIDVLRTIVSLNALTDLDVDNTSREAVIEKALCTAAEMPTILAAFDRLRHGHRPIEPNRELGHAANFLYMLRGEVPPPEDVAALNAYFVLAAEHSFNASTFTAKVVISTLSDYRSAIVAAICSLKGGAHGGANQKSMEMLLEIGEPDNVMAFIDYALATKRRLMGLGHRIYKNYDPRAAQLNEHARIVAERTGNTKWYDIARKIDEVSKTHPYFAERKIYPNVEFYSAPLLYTLGFRPDMMPALFACSRIAGWSAHVLEQLADNRLIRPSADYVGPEIRPYVPLTKRH